MEIEIRKHKNSSYDTHDEDDSYDDLSRPSKRPSNRLTMTRIAAYPRIKVLFIFFYLLFIYLLL